MITLHVRTHVRTYTYGHTDIRTFSKNSLFRLLITQNKLLLIYRKTFFITITKRPQEEAKKIVYAPREQIKNDSDRMFVTLTFDLHMRSGTFFTFTPYLRNILG